ncbi:hypothetical protein Hdeb2414_s0018g00524741 [Helianthus debilis subsp. tardiflorus]
MILELGSNAFSDKCSLVKQLETANKSIGGVVVVLAERDKQDMDIVKLKYRFMGTLVIRRSSFGFEGTTYNCTRSR